MAPVQAKKVADIEKGQTTQTEEKRPSQMHKLLNASKTDVFFFIFNPNNIPTLITLGLTLIAGAIFFMYEIQHVLRFSLLVFCFGTIGILGGGGAAYLVAATVALQDQINEFRQENEKMQEQNDTFKASNSQFENQNSKLKTRREKLQSLNEQLKNQCDALAKDLEAFKDLRQALEKSAANMEGGFQEALAQTRDMYDKIDAITKENEKIILFKAIQDVEFIDRSEGISKIEYKRFVKRVPERLQPEFEKEEYSFETLSKGDGLIEVKELHAIGRKLLGITLEEEEALDTTAGDVVNAEEKAMSST